MLILAYRKFDERLIAECLLVKDLTQTRQPVQDCGLSDVINSQFDDAAEATLL